MSPNPDKRNTSSVYRRLGLPLELENGAPPRVHSRILYILSGLIIAMLIWASVGEIREVAATSGEIAPAGSVRAIEHLEGGTIAEILAREGDFVEVGTPLARLHEVNSASELGRLESRLAWLEAEENRLVAQSDGAANPNRYEGRNASKLSKQQLAAYAANVRARNRETEALSARVAQKKAEIDSITTELSLQDDQIALEKEKYAIQSDLLKEGYTSRRRYLEAKSEYQKSLAAKAGLEGRLAQARETLAEAVAGLARAEAEDYREIATERSKIAQEREELTQQLTKFQDRFERLYVRAPVSGYIKQMAQSGPGEVVKPGDLIAEIVPTGQELVAEVRVRPNDIGHVKVGDTADVVITSYDINLQGTVPGKVRTLSASSFKDDQGQSYFKAVIALGDTAVGKDENRRPVLPGMLVQANIVTGSKSIMRYMMKPIVRSLDTAFAER